MRSILYIVLIWILGSGCMSQERCLEKFPPSVKTVTEKQIIIRDSIISGATITKVIKRDSLIQLPGEMRTYIDTSGKAELTFFRNAYGDLVVKCEAKDQTIKALNKEVRESDKEIQVHTKEVKFVPWWIYVLIGGLSLLSIPGIFKLIKMISSGGLF